MTEQSSYQRELVLARFILDGFPEPVVVLNEQGAVVDANRPAKEARGLDVIELLEPAKDQRIPAFLANLRAQGRGSLELQRATKRGGVGQFVLDGLMVGAYAVVVIRDLTERRTLDEEVRQLRRMQSLGFITASVIHDFNNLMVPIRCLSEMLSKELAGGTSAAGLAAEMRFAAERAASLVRDVHLLTRARSSKLEPLDLSTVIRDLQPLVDRMLEGKVELALSLEVQLGEALVDRERLENALLNLIANARDAMQHGGRLTITTSNVAFVGGNRESDEASSPPGYVALVVEDSGVGMSDEVRERVFDHFYTTKSPGDGSGLGLASVQRFVIDSGGLISIHSEPGRGTTITIHLPRIGRRERPTIPDIEPRDAQGGDETVLVVDRDEPVRRTVKAVLEARGYHVIEASSAENALAAAQTGKPAIDLALVDTALPRTDYSRFLRQLGAAARGVSIVLMSTQEKPANVPSDVARDRLLRKAFSEQELVRAARVALDREPGSAPKSERRTR